MPKKTERGALKAAPHHNSSRTEQDGQSLRIKALNTLCDEWSGFDENYVIGDDGHIYRRLKSGHYRSGQKFPYQQVRGYYGTEKKHTVHLHKAVALAFLDKPEECTDVDHIDNDKTNNAADNLQWLTHRENLLKISTDAKGE